MKTDWLAGIHFKQGFNFPRNGREEIRQVGNNGESSQSFHLHPMEKIIP